MIEWFDIYFGRAVAKKTRVAARLITLKGNVYYGVNIESSCHSLSICAERSAIVSAVVAEGPDMIISSVDAKALRSGVVFDIVPCGACRQLISEFSDEYTTLMNECISYWMPCPYK